MTDDTTAEDLLHFNGINGATGGYELPPMSGEELSGLLREEAEPENLADLKKRYGQRDKRGRKDERHYGVKEGVDPLKLEEAGWQPPEVFRALARVARASSYRSPSRNRSTEKRRLGT